MTRNRSRDIWASIAILILALITVFVLIPTGIDVPGSVKKMALSPDFWPRIISYLGIVSAIYLLVETLTMPPPEEEAEADINAHLWHDDTVGTLRALGLIMAMFAFYFSLAILGMVVASTILIAAMMLFFGERNYLLIAGLSLSAPILLYLFFRYIASVPIPLGIFAI